MTFLFERKWLKGGFLKSSEKGKTIMKQINVRRDMTTKKKLFSCTVHDKSCHLLNFKTIIATQLKSKYKFWLKKKKLLRRALFLNMNYLIRESVLF